MDLDVATVDRLLATTRAVRKRLDLTRPVPSEVITECIRLATQAPTAADAQNWRWVAVTDVDKRQAIAAVHRAANEAFARSQVERLGPGAERRRLDSALYLIAHLHEVPVHVLAYVLDPELEGLEGQAPPVLLYGSIFPAIWSFQLALRARGLGTSPLFVGDEAAVSAVVGAPADAHIASLLPVAYYTGESFKPARRRPVEEVLAWNAWNPGTGNVRTRE
jgi:nitroreductase